jgi:putative membrane protein
VRSLPPQDVPRLPVPWLASFLAVALAVIGLLLAVYLAVQ